MNAINNITAAYWQSFDFSTPLSRSEFTGFTLFFLVALAISYLLLGTIAVGLAAAGFPLPAALVRRGRDVGLSAWATLDPAATATASAKASSQSKTE
jgi:uncharacterized membrane protein YhaH (DUF805 family)